MIQQNDAAGGAGSITAGLLGIAINGLSRAIDGKLAQKFPLTSFNENLTVGPDGKYYPASAPAKNVSAGSTALGLLQSPVGIAIGVSVVVSVLIFVAIRAGR